MRGANFAAHCKQDMVRDIDDRVEPNPLFSIANCVHPSVAEQAVEQAASTDPGLTRRLIGLVANASALSPEELDNLSYMDGEAPRPLAEKLLRLHRRFGFTILGGCCGTEAKLLAWLAQFLEPASPPP